MDFNNPIVQDVKLQTHQSASSFESNEILKKSSRGVILIPQPSNDPRDPLNWPQRRKIGILIVLSFAAFSGTASMVANQLGLFAQAKLYNKTPVEISYTVCAAIAGNAAGPLFISPFTKRVGYSSIIFWSILISTACCIWSAEMTRSNQYNAFVAASLVRAFFGTMPSIIGNHLLMNLFFLHERGKAFAFFTLMFLLGVLAGPTFSGFIVQHVSWTVEFWWGVAAQGLSAILVLAFLEETGWDRGAGKQRHPVPPQTWGANRAATFFPGYKVVPYVSRREILSYFTSQFLIGFSPVGIIIGVYQLVIFGWFVMINTLLTVFLENPVAKKGYGFTPQQNAAFTFAFWVGLFVANGFAYAFNDRLSLWICRRRGGSWKPEYRLHYLWIPNLIFIPIGLGLFGACLQYHLHYMLLAFASFLAEIGAVSMVPCTLNYMSECFTTRTAESSCAMGCYRLSFGLAIPFFIDPWIAAVGFHWVFGIAAFISLAMFLPIMLLMWKGHAIREFTFLGLNSNEEGQRIVDSPATDSL